MSTITKLRLHLFKLYIEYSRLFFPDMVYYDKAVEASVSVC